jgi:dimethylaniline monooxygenase (N-oxide forming)
MDHVVIERSDDVGGLWRYRDNDYGVMAFTHINVSKYNYCYSDHQFPEETTDYPHHSEMQKYIRSYADKYELFDHISFNTEAVIVEG